MQGGGSVPALVEGGEREFQKLRVLDDDQECLHDGGLGAVGFPVLDAQTGRRDLDGVAEQCEFVLDGKAGFQRGKRAVHVIEDEHLSHHTPGPHADSAEGLRIRHQQLSLVDEGLDVESEARRPVFAVGLDDDVDLFPHLHLHGQQLQSRHGGDLRTVWSLQKHLHLLRLHEGDYLTDRAGVEANRVSDDNPVGNTVSHGSHSLRQDDDLDGFSRGDGLDRVGHLV